MVHMVAGTDSNPKGWKCMFTNICSQIANSLLSLFPSNHHPPTTSLYHTAIPDWAQTHQPVLIMCPSTAHWGLGRWETNGKFL
jgi:hypothetical protein